MSNQDYFPEDGYDPASGEYSNQFDFEPGFEQRVYLDFERHVYADIGAETEYEDVGQRAVDILNDLAGRGYFSGAYDPDNPEGYPPTPDDFDYGGEIIRGPFPDNETVERFLNESGLRGVAVVYHDIQYNEFYIDVNTN